MDKLKKCLSLILMAACCAYTIDGFSQDSKEHKQMVIIKKTVDDNGNETVVKKVFEGDEISDVEMEKLMNDDGAAEMDIWVSADGEEHKLDAEEHEMMIFTADDEMINKFLAKNNLSKEDIESMDLTVDSEIENGVKTVVKRMTVIDKDGKKYELNIENGGKEVITKGPVMQFDYVPSKPKLGVMVESDAKGAKITEVIPDSPADNAGFQAGDIIYGIGETPIANSEDLVNSLANAQERIFVAYIRDGQAANTWVTLTPFEFKSGTKEVQKQRIIMKN